MATASSAVAARMTAADAIGDPSTADGDLAHSPAVVAGAVVAGGSCRSPGGADRGEGASVDDQPPVCAPESRVLYGAGVHSGDPADRTAGADQRVSNALSIIGSLGGKIAPNGGGSLSEGVAGIPTVPRSSAALWSKVAMAVKTAAAVKQAPRLLEDFDAPLRRHTFRASFGKAERNIGDYVQTEAPAVHSYVEPASTLKTNGIAWREPHKPRARPEPTSRKLSVLEVLGSAGGSPTALSRRVLPDTQKSHSAPTSLRGSPKATPWAPPARQTHLVLPDLQLRGCNSMPTTPKRVRGPSREYAPGSSITRLGPDHGGESTSEPLSFRSHPPVFQRLPGARWEAPALGRRSPSEGGAATTATTAATSPVVNGEGDSTTFFMPNPPPTIGRPVESDLRLAPPAPRLRGVQRAQLRPSGEIPPIDDAKVQARQRAMGKVLPSGRAKMLQGLHESPYTFAPSASDWSRRRRSSGEPFLGALVSGGGGGDAGKVELRSGNGSVDSSATASDTSGDSCAPVWAA